MVHCAVDSMLSHDSPLSRKYETRLPYMDANRESGWKTRCGCSVRNSKRAKHRGSVVLNGSRGVLNSSARDALAATPPHALRARNLHTPPPTCPPSRPAPALASRPPPKTAPPRYAARTRRLPRALPSRVPRPFRLPRRSRARDRRGSRKGRGTRDGRARGSRRVRAAYLGGAVFGGGLEARAGAGRDGGHVGGGVWRLRARSACGGVAASASLALEFKTPREPLRTTEPRCFARLELRTEQPHRVFQPDSRFASI